jgi:CubicO group peptidase (beta-lactamase class C family)
VCSRLVEVISCERFDDYLQATIFDPLGMVDTGSFVPEENAERLAALYTRDASKQLTLLGAQYHPTSRFRQVATVTS